MNNGATAAFLDRLRAIEGLPVNTDSQQIAQACTDWRKRYHTDALAVLQPRTVDQIQQLVRVCNQFDVAVCTQGGNTGLAGGAVPASELCETHAHIVLNLNKLRNELTVDTSNLTLTASAGYTLGQLQKAAEEAGFLFPLSLASEGTCTIGGNLASNAGGVAVLRYGNARELCLGLEFVNAQGEICSEMRGLRKNNSGYDLRHLLIGSEGTLGIITKACLKIYPKPTATVVVWFNVGSIHNAVSLLGVLQRRLFSELSSYEWMNKQAIELVQTHFTAKAPRTPAYPDCEHVLAEFSSLGSQESLTEQVENVLVEVMDARPDVGVLGAYVSQSLKENRMFWSLRENISEAQAKEGLNIKHDVACATSALPVFHDAALAAIEKLGLEVRPVLFGHLGDGNLHFNLSGPIGKTGCNSSDFLLKHQKHFNDLVHGEILKAGGTVSAEHGIGQLKLGLLEEITLPANYSMFKAIKLALDPKNLLNPGKLVRV